MSNKPIEYTNAILAVDTAWKRYDEAIERGESYEVINEYGKTAQYLEKHKSNIYAMWQDLGGTGDIKTLVNVNPTAVEQATEAEPEKEANGLEGLESLFTEHNEKIKGLPIYKNNPATCEHKKETGMSRGMQCRGCGRIREPKDWFEKQLVARYNPRGRGYVHYR